MPLKAENAALRRKLANWRRSARVRVTDSVHVGVERLREASGLTARLRDRGVTEADLDTRVAGVSGNLGNGPVGATADAGWPRALSRRPSSRSRKGSAVVVGCSPPLIRE